MKNARAFSLLELLVVLSIMATLMVLSAPMVSSLFGSRSVDKAIGDLSLTLAQARAYAMANGTYVRVGFSEVERPKASPSVVMLCLYSTDGTLNAASATDMASDQKWAAIGHPLVLNNFDVNDALGDEADATPYLTDMAAFDRSVGALGPVHFRGCIQFSPSGGARVESDIPSRFVKIAVDRPAPMAGKNPFVIRLAGMTGAIMVLRKENL